MDSKFFKLGPDDMYRQSHDRSCYIALADHAMRVSEGCDHLIGPKCSNLMELKDQVAAMKEELDRIADEAEKRG